MAGGGLWRVMAGSPRRFLLSRWPWRCLAYLSTSVLIGLVLLVLLALTALFPPAWVLASLPVGALERRRLRLVGRAPVDSPHATPSPGLGAWLRLRLAEGATWREFGYLLTLATVLLLADFAGLLLLLTCVGSLSGPLVVAWTGTFRFGPLFADTMGEALAISLLLGPVVALAGLYGTCALAGAQAAFAHRLIGPRRTEVDRKVDELARSRGRLVQAFEAERRRIERDLHDGAQQRLVSLAMNLGMARAALGDAPEPARRAIEQAHDEATLALAELREFVRGLHPAVMNDRGLDAALSGIAARAPVPVRLTVSVEPRCPADIEAIAYFTVSEALTNVARHAGAHRAEVSVERRGDVLRIVVTDDGHGGADEAGGTGLRGLAQRAQAVDGTMTVHSPPGGPTTITVELPCAS